jgi:hypothetical protein
MENFFPTEDYKVPETSNYMKFIEGENPFRVLSSAVVGYEYFTKDNKPIRSKEVFENTPSDIKKDGTVKHFWAFVVWNYSAKRIQILELTQKGIMKTMQAYIKNSKWGNPREYDFIVSRAGSGLDTEYATSVNPKEILSADISTAYENTKVNLEALYDGEDPFAIKEA